MSDEDSSDKSTLSRRDFLKFMATTGAGIFISFYFPWSKFMLNPSNTLVQNAYATSSSEVLTDFNVHKHGFKFVNDWKGDILLDIPIIGRINVGRTPYGLCGGMTYAALDTFHSQSETPDDKDPPESGSELRSYIYNRQMDTFKAQDAFMIRRIISWSIQDIGKSVWGPGLHALTHEQFKKRIRPEIDKGNPVPLCLIRAKRSDYLLTSKSLKPEGFTINHQVLAIGYRRHDPPDGPEHWDVDIYDNNYPNEVHTLHYHRKFRKQTLRKNSNGMLVEKYDSIGSNVSGSFRAFFKTPYEPKTPYWVTGVQAQPSSGVKVETKGK